MFPQRDLEGLIRIFHIESKKELSTYCKKLTIFADDFAYLIRVCKSGLLPYLHLSYVRDYIPEHLVPTNQEDQAIRRAAPGPLVEHAAKFASKVRQIFSDRQFLVGHLFCTPDKRYWHFFYFDQRDAALEGNHWVGGSHMHLVNDLWRDLSVDALIERFVTGNPKFGKSLHIRFDRQWRRAPKPGRVRPVAHGHD